MKNMRIVHINLFDAPRGEAEVAWTLTQAMTDMGHEVHIFAHQKHTTDPRVIPIPFPQTKWQKQLMVQQSRRGLFDIYSAALLHVLHHEKFEEADLVHLHCTNGGYFSFLLLPFLTAKPTIWTLHEPSAFTGGCLNTNFCDNWRQGWCADCPKNRKKELQREAIQLLKGSIYNITDITVICSYAAFADKAKASILRNKDIRYIYGGVDTNIYQPGNCAELREKLRLPQDKRILLFPASGDIDSYNKGCAYLNKAMSQLNLSQKILLVHMGASDNSELNAINVERLFIPFNNNSEIVRDYYAAADLVLAPSPAETFNLDIAKAMACGVPVVGLNLGGNSEIVCHNRTGYLAEYDRCEDFAFGITRLLENEELRQYMADNSRKSAETTFSQERMVAEYAKVYEEVAQRSPEYWSVYPKERICERVEKSRLNGWESVWEEFNRIYDSYDSCLIAERSVFTDCFLSECLSMVNPVTETEHLWQIIELWASRRKLPARCAGMAEDEKEALHTFSIQLRQKLHEYLLGTPAHEMAKVSGARQQIIVSIWWQLFFDSFAPVNQRSQVSTCECFGKEIPGISRKANRFIRLVDTSLYHPFVVGNIPLSGKELWNASEIPVWCKIILSYWLLNIPYYNIEEQHRQKVVRYLPGILQAPIPAAFFFNFANQMVDYLWRISYAGGNHVKALSQFGDFLTKYVGSLYPQLTNAVTANQPGRKKIRIGYISRLFRNQAVSYYMVNRVIHHDRDKFEVFVFSLSDAQDWMSELFAENCDRFIRFNQSFDIANVSQSILACNLDILIYTDIGMDAATYCLATLQLAPVQCVMVGHGTTTGLPTIQYYISGDFEPDKADDHYREKLIRLPCLGAAQYPPSFVNGPLPTRKEWKIPDDVVVFVSCANGIKHPPARDALLMDILKKAPNSCLVLKPHYFHNEDQKLPNRLQTAAAKANVSDRLFIVPPLKHVDALLAIADIQLDTYPYGGWTTNMEALYSGLPIVTQEGELARSRWGSHMLKELGISEGIAKNEKEYVDWAVKYALDTVLRYRVKEFIKERAAQVLFNGPSAQAAYEQVLLSIARNHGL